MTILLIKIDLLENYLWINYILLKQKLFMTQPNRITNIK